MISFIIKKSHVLKTYGKNMQNPLKIYF